MNVRLRMYQVLLFKFGRHLCKGSIVFRTIIHIGRGEGRGGGGWLDVSSLYTEGGYNLYFSP